MRLKPLVLALVLLASLGLAQNLRERVRLYTLENGLRVIMVPDRTAPVIYFNLLSDYGGVDEPPGLGGLAHMVEHMAFKGTQSIGSRDWAKEQVALQAVETARDALDAARKSNATKEELDRLTAAFNKAREEAQALQQDSGFDDLFTRNGAQGLNASTGYDRTNYTVALPSNRLELYLRIYADVLLNPVFRSFYEEADVVREERRQRTENDPNGFLFENFLAAAYKVHPYGRPLIGSAEEIAGYRTAAALELWRANYHPNRMVLAMVGDLEPERDIALVRKYFGAVPRGPNRPANPIPAEPPQTAERRVTVNFNAQPAMLIGFHKPTYPSREAYVLDIVDAILTDGRTSRLFRRMVTQDQVAANVSSSSGSPGIRFPNMFLFSIQPRAPKTPEDVEKALYEELEKLKTELVSAEELQKVKAQTRVGYLRALAGGSGLAFNLAFYEMFLGGWAKVLEEEQIYASVTAEEIREVARKYFTPENRTVAILLPRR